MDLLTPEDLAAIATPKSDGPHVSLFMPTQRISTESEADRLRWKNLIAGVEAKLLTSMRRPDVETLLKPARDLLNDSMEWNYMSDGLVMFLNADGHESYRVPAPVNTLAAVGDRFVLGPLIRLVSGDEHFFMLALSQRKIRLLEGSRNTVEDIQLADIPASLAEVITPHDSRSDAMARPVSVRGGRAIFYGHGGGDDHLKQDELNRFLRTVASGIRQLLGGQTSPLVLVGLENLVVGFRENNDYPYLMDEVVERNADDLSDEELHQLAWPVVEKRLQERRADVFERFKELDGTGKVSSDLQLVTQAAVEGRVETLFVRADPWAWDRATDELEPVVVLGEDTAYTSAELVDKAAIATLHKGGRVFATAQTVVPDREVAAIFRF